MPDETPPTAFPADSLMARLAAYEQRAAALIPANKANLFAALADAGITSVTVMFDSSGDSGQIESIGAKAGESVVALPDTPVEIAHTEFFSDDIHRRSLPLPEAVESLCYLLLESKHDGWENNEGAYGEFVFDVANDSIAFDFNYRIETSENHTYQF